METIEALAAHACLLTLAQCELKRDVSLRVLLGEPIENGKIDTFCQQPINAVGALHYDAITVEIKNWTSVPIQKERDNVRLGVAEVWTAARTD